MYLGHRQRDPLAKTSRFLLVGVAVATLLLSAWSAGDRARLEQRMQGNLAVPETVGALAMNDRATDSEHEIDWVGP